MCNRFGLISPGESLAGSGRQRPQSVGVASGVRCDRRAARFRPEGQSTGLRGWSSRVERLDQQLQSPQRQTFHVPLGRP